MAFVVTAVDIATNTYRAQVWLADVDGTTTPHAITSGDKDLELPKELALDE